MILFLIYTLFIPHICTGGEISQTISFIILSQTNDFHSQVSQELKNDLQNQCKDYQPIIFLTHKDFSHAGSWTIFPIVLNISTIVSPHVQWFIFLEDHTGVNVKNLNGILQKYNYKEKIWVGNELFDEDATIIHHFAFHKNPQFFKYPNIPSGFAMSSVMLKSLAQRLEDNAGLPDFSIDSSHELALYIWDEGKGPMLTHDRSFCTEKSPKCATYVNTYSNQNKPLPKENIYIAVKTHEKFHEERINVVKKTLGKVATNIKYFSNIEDKSIPTVDLGIPNTERGHCAKTMAILKYIHEEIERNELDILWIAVVDDDTILSLSRLQQLLSRYNHSQDVAVGERYGYNVAGTPSKGYNYLTGGGSMVFSIPLVKKLILNCKCPTQDAPDDMIIGLCMASLKIEITHSPAFHQARPVDYSKKYLQNQEPISFHKHWMIDPVKVYEEWFAEADEEKTFVGNKHYEL